MTTASKTHSRVLDGAVVDPSGVTRIIDEDDREATPFELALIEQHLGLEEQLEAVEGERDYFRDRLPDFSAVQQAEFARAEALQEQLEAAPTEREMRCFARVLDPDRYPLPGEDFTEIINEALAALRRVMPLLDASSPASEPS